MNKIIKNLKGLRWDRILITIIILEIFIYGCISLTQDIISLFNKNDEIKITVVKTQLSELSIKEDKVKEPKSKQYRLTSYYTNDGYKTTACTGSGLCIKDFQINDKGWYTYEGKLVIAAATYECLNSKSNSDACSKWNNKKEGRKYFRYFEELQVVIDGVKYDAIVLDSCGGSMYLDDDLIDLFVSNSSSAIFRGYKGVNTVSVFADFE